jgi:hypothetical protein
MGALRARDPRCLENRQVGPRVAHVIKSAADNRPNSLELLHPFGGVRVKPPHEFVYASAE